MKFTAALLLTALLTFIGGLYAPWWIIAPVAFGVAILVHQKGWKAWLAGFLAVFLTWCALAWWIDSANDSILSKRVGELLGAGANPVLLVLLSGFTGALVSGFAALAGHYLRTSPRRH